MSAAEFIKGAGGSLVSRNILDRRGNIKWLSREDSVNPADNGWRILSDVDTDEFLSDPDNMAVVDFNAMRLIHGGARNSETPCRSPVASSCE